MSTDPFDMMRQSILAIQTQNELTAARVQIAELRKELAEAQENYHLVNEAYAKLLKERQGDA